VDDKKAAYVAAHGATHHAAHRATHHAAHKRGDRQGLPALPALFGSTAEKIFQGKTLPIFCRLKNASTKKRLLSPMASVGGPIPIVKGCRRCLVLPRRKIFRGKPDSAEALPIFCRPKNASTKKGLLSPMASVGGRRDHQGSPVLTALFDEFQGETGQGGTAANFLLAQEHQYRKEAVSAHGVGGQSDHPWDLDKDSKASDALGGTMDATDRAAMRVLTKNRSVHGTTACKLAKATSRAETAPGWAGMGADHAAWVQALHQDQSNPDAAIVDITLERVYLAIMNGANHFSVLHHLHWWKAAEGGCSRTNGCIVAFEGEVRDAYGLPLLWRFDKKEEGLLHLRQLQSPALHRAALFYRDGKNDGRFHNPRGDTVNMCSRLIPIPVGWAHLFQDYPSLGVAFWRSN
jgi:hypothetical protein